MTDTRHVDTLLSMGEISKPFMSPLGVLYRSLCDSDREALKYAEWAVKTFPSVAAGPATSFNILGPGRKGMYEAAILATIPADAQWVKKPHADTSWHGTPEQACVLFDRDEAPLALYFHKRELLLKPTLSPPLIAHFALSLEQ